VGGGNQVIPGVPTPPEEQQELTSLRALFDPKVAMDRLGAYGKWLFGSATIVGALGAGLSNAALSKLRGPGIVSFAVSVGLFGVSLFFASLSIAPHWVRVRLTELDSLRDAVNKQFASRQRVLTVASVAFAVALLMAAFSPLISLTAKKAPPVVNYLISDKGDLDASIEASDLGPGVSASLRLEAADATKAIFASAGSTADNNGHVKIQLKKSGVISLPGNIDLVACVGQSSQATCPNEQRTHVIVK
jgi:hypothetical protein